jgi:dynein heavy chain
MGTFVTFNIGYIGRAILPENVQNLLRPIAMVVPDYKLIAENILFSYGFSKASVLA